MPRRKAVKTKSTASKVKIEKETSLTVPTRQLSLPPFIASASPRTRMLMLVATVLLVAGLYFLYKFLVVAWVDGRPVTRTTLYQQLEKRYGAEMKNQMVAEALIKSEASKRRIQVTDEEIEAEYQKFVLQYGGEENINAALSAQGVNPADFKDQIRMQTLIKKMFGNVQVSDDEVKQYVEQNQDQFAEATDQAKLQADVRSELEQQKLTTDFRTWLTETLKSSRVTQY